MGEPDLPVDFTQVKPIPLRKTVLIVNNFLVNTVKFLNHFANTCEEKLAASSAKMPRGERWLVQQVRGGPLQGCNGCVGFYLHKLRPWHVRR